MTSSSHVGFDAMSSIQWAYKVTPSPLIPTDSILQEDMANLPRVTVTTGLSCRRQTRATRCVKPIVLLDASVIEQLVTDDHHTERPPMLTTLAAVSVQLRKKNSKSRVWTKFQREVPLFWRYPKYLQTERRISRL